MADPAQYTRVLDLTQQEQEEEYNPYVQQPDEEAPAARTSGRTQRKPKAEPMAAETPVYTLPEGGEHTGRWTKEEHDAFLKGIELYGKEWKKVAALVKTRTVVQTRTHAQKYFQKVQKANEKGGSEVDMNYSDKKPSRKTKRQRARQQQQEDGDARRGNAAFDAAQVISNMSGEKKPRAVPPPAPYGSLWGEQLKILAPQVTQRNHFPEPSPAATGKRKLAELAAARMLAGVGTGVGGDGPPTPPPPSAAPLGSGQKKPLSLQIVNPSSLGVTSSHKSGDSPTTPWEGDLDKLVSRQSEKEDDAPAVMNLATLQLPVVAPGAIYERSLLHQSICDQNMEHFHRELQGAGHRVLNGADAAGFSCMHSACALRLSQPETTVPSEIVKLLVQQGADASQVDEDGNTPLHWAARAGDFEVTETLLYRNSHMDVKNHQGESPLHWAMRTGRRGTRVVQLLLESGAKASVLSHRYRRPLDVAGEGFLDEDASLASIMKKQDEGQKVSKALQRALRESEAERRECRGNFFLHSQQSRALVLYHPKCQEHHPKSEHDWEAPDRINYIMGRVVPSRDAAGNTETSGIYPYEVSVSQEFEKAKLDLLSRVHSAEYLSFVNNLHKELEQQLRQGTMDGDVDDADDDVPPPPPPVIPFTPMVQRQMIKVAESSIKQGINSDTAFSVGSLTAARYAAGAVQHAVDRVLVGRNRNAFCVVRPPGHHAGISGLLDNGESCGFCIFNNVAAGAMYAISDDRLLCDRCAIVDIDVHHGNGTEEIIRKCHDPRKLFFFSIHLYDNDKRSSNRYPYKFYPGTGEEDDLALNIINAPIVPLWKQPSTQQPPRRHATRQKTRSSQEDSSSETSDNVKDGSQTPSDVGSAEPVLSSNGAGMSGRVAYRQSIKARLLPALRAFNPDLILISAGFDACKGDVGNARHEAGGKERIGLDLEPEDYAWTTRQILQVADMCCNGRVVSVLEGGYGRSAPVGEGLDRSSFAECAVRHLHALVDPYDTEQRFKAS